MRAVGKALGSGAALWIAGMTWMSCACTGCASDPESTGGRPGGGTGGFGNATAGSGGASGTTGGTAGTFGGNPIAGSGGTGVGGIGGAGGIGPIAGTSGACGGDTYGAETRPLDIYVMMDKSLSMVAPVDIWGPTSMALNQFFTSPDTAGISVGISFFASACDVAGYQTPVVPVAELPGNAPALQSALMSTVAELGTATTPALQGAIAYARQRATESPDRKQIVLLVTDGQPAFCGSTLASASAAAAEGVSGTPSIPTYVLGLGNIGGLDQMAAAGGTGQAFIVSDPMQVQAVVDAINSIREQALPCEYQIPESSSEFIKTLVNLKWTHDGGETLVPYVGALAMCDAAQGGWYYDDEAAPTQLVACPQTCEQLKGGGSVSVVLGCPQVVVD